LAATGVIMACSVNSDTVPGKVNPTLPPADQDATASDAQDQPDTHAPPGAPICNHYPNGRALVTQITADLLNELGRDCRISAHFLAPKNGAAHLSQCLESQIATFFQCDGATYANDLAGKPCRTMIDAHKGMNLRPEDFDAFTSDLVTVLNRNGLTPKDINDVYPTFRGTEVAIVPDLQKKSYSMCACPNDIIPDSGIYCGLDAGIDASDAGDGGDGGIEDAATDG
jgi:hypothetical protein